MTTVKMKMVAFSASQMGIFSTIRCGDTELFTLEPPWNTNNPYDQCIPAGIYDVARIPNQHVDDEWLILDVEGRNAITFDIGNVRANTNGNILLGAELGAKNDSWAIRKNDLAFDWFDKCLKDVDIFRLYIDRSIINQNMNYNTPQSRT